MPTQTLFAGGTLIHRKRAADAALDQAGAAYQVGGSDGVPERRRRVARARYADADALDAAGRAENAAQKSLEVARQQLELGSVSYLALINAEQSLSAGGDQRGQARANRYADTAALFQALGGSVSPNTAQNLGAR